MANPSPTVTAPAPGSGQRARVLWAGFLGTVIEWFDYYVYASAAAVIFNKIFFPTLNSFMGTIAAFGTIGVGYFARPLGGIVYGHFGDRFGRKKVLVSSVLLMGLCTVLVGLMPTYAQIGVLAPILLTILRVVQGVASGGEWGGAVLMSIEHFANSRWRAVAASVPQMGIGLGIALSTGSFAVVTGAFSEQELFSWGWRIPFLASVVLVGLALFIRLGIEESPVFTASQARQADGATPRRVPVAELLRARKATLILAIVLVMGPYAAKTVLNSFGPAYAVQIGFERSTVLTVASVTTLVALVCTPIAAMLAEWKGRRVVYVTGCVLLAAASYITFWLFNTGALGLLVAGYVLVTLVHPLAYGVQSGYVAELFGARIRYTGASLAYHTGGVVGGGVAPLAAASILAASGGAPHNVWFSGFLAVCCLASAVAALFTRETRRTDLTLD